MIGCVRRGGRWHAYAVADLLALLSLPGDDAVPITCGADVVRGLLDHLEARGVALAPGGHDLLHVNGEAMTTTERRAVRHLRRELHAALIERQPGRTATRNPRGADS